MTAQTHHTYVPLLIRERRMKKGLSQFDLSEKMGVTRNSVNRWERGWNPPTQPQRRKLAKALGGSASDYEWTEDDFARRDRLTQAMLEVRKITRQLLSGEL